MDEKKTRLLKQFYQKNVFVHFASLMESLSKENVLKLNSLKKSSEISSSISSASLNQQKRVNAVKRALWFNAGHVKYTVPNHGQSYRICSSNINYKMNKNNVNKNENDQDSNDSIAIKKLQASGDYTLEYAI